MVFKSMRVFMLYFSISMHAYATTKAQPVDLSPLRWSACEEEIRSEQIPRTCLVLAVEAAQLGYRSFHHKIEEHCLKQVSRWVPIDQADRVILKSYFPKCYYRSQALERSLEPKLELWAERDNLVRFLYMNHTDGNSDTNEKRLPNTLKARSGP